MTAESERIDAARTRAEARFKRIEQQKTDAEKVWVEREAEQAKQLEKTTRLRALRLAKEEADRRAGSTTKKPPRTARKKSPLSTDA
jgi:hypothetical protein